MQRFSLENHLTKDFTESELIAACVKHDAQAQRVVYERFYAKMLGVCTRYVGNRETAKDVVQDGFVVVFEKIGTFAGTGSFEGWVRKIFVNVALTYLRKNDALRFSEPIDTSLGKSPVESSVLEGIAAKELLQSITEMPAGFRSIFNLYAVEGYSHQEIAQMLHINESTSRSQYSRARNWLQNKLNNKRR